MSQDAATLEKSTTAGLGAREDARALLRLIQCTRCSKPFRNPVLLPCGNTLCRDCLPEPQQRERNVADIVHRKQVIPCPFSECQDEHPYLDCSIDVVLAKVMESIAEVVAKYSSVVNGNNVRLEEVQRSDDVMDTEEISEKPRVHEMSGGRLIATYMLASQGNLDYRTELMYYDTFLPTESEQVVDVQVLQDILEATNKEVDCQVCYNVMLDPVTTFCGHTLCRKCMARVLDHSLHCPVCRRPLAIPPLLSRHPSNKTLVQLLDGLCPDAIAIRKSAEPEDFAAPGSLNVPLFVCTLGFPHQPTYLRIFEPRYRLMLRRCLEGNREFGMLMYNQYGEPQGDLGPVHFYHYGTMLYIVRAQVLADGTSMIETRGAYRFRVLSHGVLDGYAVGNVERVEDVSLAEEQQAEADETSLPPAEDNDIAGQIDRMSTQALLDLGQEFIRKMQRRSANWLQQRMLDAYGQPPDDAATFPYWLASVLPINENEKYKLLPTRTVRARLKIAAMWIRRIEAQRWYHSSNCRIL